MTNTVADAPVPQEDNLALDLIDMLDKANVPKDQQQIFMDQVTPYLVERDHKIFTHAYEAGRAST